MKVIATATGFFQKVRLPDEVFDVPQGMKGSWFAPVDKAQAKTLADAHEKAAKAANGARGGNDLV